MEAFLITMQAIGKLIAGLSILVTIHELGHFLPAKLFKMRVEKFYLFFPWPRKIWSVKKDGTEYGIGLLPLGGFVTIAGMIDESLNTENLKKAPEPWEFRAKPVWQRLIVMVGGVTMNVLLAILIMWLWTYFMGETYTPMSELKTYGLDVRPHSLSDTLGFKTGDKLLTLNGQSHPYLEQYAGSDVLLGENNYYEVDRNGQKVSIPVPNDFVDYVSSAKGEQLGMLFRPNGSSKIAVPEAYTPQGDTILSRARDAGIKTGDSILAVNGTPITQFADIFPIAQANKNKTVQISVLRGADSLQFNVPLDSTGVLGVAPILHFVHIDYSLGEAFALGTGKAFTTVTNNLLGFKKLFKGDVSVQNSVSGPIGMVRYFKRIPFWPLVAMLSMVLAFMNILPIPALDGGHVVFLLIEAVTGREPSQKVVLIAQQAGMVLLILLMAAIMFNDILRLF